MRKAALSAIARQAQFALESRQFKRLTFTPVAQRPNNSTGQRLARAARLALIGVSINAAFAVAKLSAGIFGHCYALIADGLESTLDIFSSLVIWGGLVVAARPPDDTHPYGHGKAEPLASVGVAVMVIGAAVTLGVQSIHEIVTPHHAPAPFTLAVLLIVILVKELLFRRVLHAADEMGSTAVKTDAWHHRADAITSLAAFIGISIALIGGPGYESADDWAALFACLLIAFNGWRLLVPSLNETMDVAPSPVMTQSVRAVAQSTPGVVAIDQCRVRKMGLDFYVDMHVEVDGDLTVTEGHRIAHEVKDAIRKAEPTVVDVLVHVEPAGKASARTDQA